MPIEKMGLNMNFRKLALRIVVSLLASSSILSIANAQSGVSQTIVSRTSGLELAITSSTAHQQNIIIQFELTNTTPARVYIRDARTDDAQTGFLSSGTHLYTPNSVVSIESCGSVQQCLNDPSSKDINAYSYIEPNDKLSFSFQYSTQSPVQPHDTISFTVALISRVTQQNGDPSNATPPKPLRFNFSRVPIAQ